MKIRSIFVIVLGLIMLVMLTPAWADGGGGTRALIKNQHIYGDLGGEFWEWAFDTGFAMFDDGEVDCSLGQSGWVWFLAGTFGGAAERSCTIPRNKSLFIPLVNYFLFYEAGVDDEVFDLTLQEKRIFLDGQVGGGSLSEPEAVKALADYLEAVSTEACDLHATLDGEPLVFTTPIVRGQSGPFTLTTDNEALADGFYVLLPPLDAGLHELKFGGALCDKEGTRLFETTVIYTLDVRGRKCDCDLNQDGSCDGKDWLIFFPDWGRTDCNEPEVDPCECDLDSDGNCDGKDWLIFFPDWGRTDCPIP